MQKGPEETIRDYTACHERLDIEGALSYLTDDCVIHAAPSPDPTIGREAIAAKWAGAFEHMQSFDCEILSMATNGNTVFCESVQTIGSSGGHEVRLEVVTVFELDDAGKIRATHEYYDVAAALLLARS